MTTLQEMESVWTPALRAANNEEFLDIQGVPVSDNALYNISNLDAVARRCWNTAMEWNTSLGKITYLPKNNPADPAVFKLSSDEGIEYFVYNTYVDSWEGLIYEPGFKAVPATEIIIRDYWKMVD